MPRQGHLDNDVSEHLADNGHLLLAPEIRLRKIFIKVRKSDSLASLAAHHGVTTANLATWNKLQPNARMRAGQKLAVYVPAQSARSTRGTSSTSKSSPRRVNQTRAKASPKARSAKSRPVAKR